MPVLARILMLVACGPLLQPTGYCVCKAGGFGGPSSVPVRGTSEVPHNSSTGKKAGCTCSHCAAPAEGQPAGDPVAQTPPAKPSPADDHLPGCPASPGADSLKWVDPSPQVVVVLALLEVVVIHAAEPASVVPQAAPTSARYSSSPPLYLSHCSLVI